MQSVKKSLKKNYESTYLPISELKNETSTFPLGGCTLKKN